MRISEVLPSKEELARILINNINNTLRVCAPGVIQSFDKESQTVTVQLALRESLKTQEEDSEWVQIPPLLDVPIVIPRAGGYALTLPIKKGDECLVMFSDMCIDGWFTHGGIQNQIEKRRHDLSDGFAILGTWSQPNKIENYSGDSCQLRNDSGSSYIELKENDVNIVASSINLNGTVSANGLNVNTHKHSYPEGETSEPY